MQLFRIVGLNMNFSAKVIPIKWHYKPSWSLH